MKTRLCFIDDDRDFEVPLFHKTFDDDFDIISGTELSEVRKKIQERNKWNPELFVLDLYFPIGTPDRAAIKSLCADKLDLVNDVADMRKAYCNFISAKDRLQKVLAAWGQGPDGGLQLAKNVAKEFPKAPIVFYSRKATFEDAVRCMAIKNVRDVIIKPTAKSDKQTQQITTKERPRLAKAFRDVISPSNPNALEGIKRAAEMITGFFIRSVVRSVES